MVDVPGIRFMSPPARVAADPNRMDIALFVGLLPLREGAEAKAAREQREAELVAQGWSDERVETSAGALLDLPVRVTSIEAVEQMFNTGGRLDRRVALASRLLAPTLEIEPEEVNFVLNLDGADQRVTLPTGTLTRSDLRNTLAAELDGVEVEELEEINGKAALEFRRTASHPGSITIFTHEKLGFPVSMLDQSQATGSPMGVALRHFFEAGGREAVIVRMGNPPPLYAPEAERLAALYRLIRYGDKVRPSALADLVAVSPAPLPGAFPTHDPWHGLAHLHGLSDVAMVLMPDLPDLVATVPGVEREVEALRRPEEAFKECAPAPTLPMQGALSEALPASVTPQGLQVWGNLAAWVASEVRQITHEAMAILATPMTADPSDETPGDHVTPDDVLASAKSIADRSGLANCQIQVAAPWFVSRSAYDLPAKAAPPDGLLAGHIAASTLESGGWRTVAGRRLAPSQRPYGPLSRLTLNEAPQLTILGYGARGPAILSDRTFAAALENQAHIRRLTALILRAARIRGDSLAFEPNGPKFWSDVRLAMATLLRQLHSEGAFRGQREDDAFRVSCGRETMSQSDIDAGRAIAEIVFAPAHSIEHIEISLVAADGAIRSGGTTVSGRLAA